MNYEDDPTERLMNAQAQDEADTHEVYEEQFVPGRDLVYFNGKPPELFFYLRRVDTLYHYVLTNGRCNLPLFGEHDDEDHHCTAFSADAALRSIQLANRRMQTTYLIKTDV